MLWWMTSASRVLAALGLIVIAGILAAPVGVCLTGILVTSGGVSPTSTALVGIALSSTALADILLFNKRWVICLHLLVSAGVYVPFSSSADMRGGRLRDRFTAGTPSEMNNLRCTSAGIGPEVLLILSVRCL
jgi:hypothetical protein